MAARKPPGKGLIEKRTRLVRLLAGHVRYLEMLATMAPFTPRAFGHEPRPRQTPAEWAARWEAYAPPRYVSPRARPALAHACPGPEAVTDEQIKEWLAADPFVRGGLSPATARAMAFMATFAPRAQGCARSPRTRA